MARHYYKSGEWNVWCMVCNRKIKSGEAMKRWDGLWVCKEDFENRHPLDFLRARQERISVPFVASTSFDTFDNPVYPVYPFCTQEGASGVSGFAVAGCMRPNLGFPNGLPVPQPEIPDEPLTDPITLISGANILLVSGNTLVKVNVN